MNVALFSCIQQVAQKQQNLRCVIKGNEIEVAGSMVHIAEFREELQKCVALKSNQHDLELQKCVALKSNQHDLSGVQGELIGRLVDTITFS